MSFKLNGAPYNKDNMNIAVYRKDLKDGSAGKSNHTGIIVDKDVSPEMEKAVIAHETVHQHQQRNGELDYDKKNFYWKGKTYPRENLNEHNENLPWEKEAYAKSNGILNGKQENMKERFQLKGYRGNNKPFKTMSDRGLIGDQDDGASISDNRKNRQMSRSVKKQKKQSAKNTRQADRRRSRRKEATHVGSSSMTSEDRLVASTGKLTEKRTWSSVDGVKKTYNNIPVEFHVNEDDRSNPEISSVETKGGTGRKKVGKKFTGTQTSEVYRIKDHTLQGMAGVDKNAKELQIARSSTMSSPQTTMDDRGNITNRPTQLMQSKYNKDGIKSKTKNYISKSDLGTGNPILTGNDGESRAATKREVKQQLKRAGNKIISEKRMHKKHDRFSNYKKNKRSQAGNRVAGGTKDKTMMETDKSTADFNLTGLAKRLETNTLKNSEKYRMPARERRKNRKNAMYKQ